MELIEFKCSHPEKALLKIYTKFYFCFKCSSIIIKEHDIDIYTIKPKKYFVIQENTAPIVLSIYDNHHSYSFINKSDYLKIRFIIIKEMKIFCNNLNLNRKTFFLSLDYLDRICSKMISFEIEDLKQISQFCVILASKFQENGVKGIEVKKFCFWDSNTFSKDELYLLKLLDYNLHTFTSYDILVDILQIGFIFSNEHFSFKKLNIIYDKIENILYLFSESRYYIEMTHKEIAFAIIGLIREKLGLDSFNSSIKSIFMNDSNDIDIYLLCLNKLKKCFKFNDNCNNSK